MRSREELEGKLQAFPDTYENYMGEPLDINVLKGYLLEQLSTKKRQFIDQAFNSMTVSDIKTLLNHIQSQIDKPVVVETIKKKGKKWLFIANMDQKFSKS